MKIPRLAMYKQNGYIVFLKHCTICMKTCPAKIAKNKCFPFYFLLSIFGSMVTQPLLHILHYMAYSTVQCTLQKWL